MSSQNPKVSRALVFRIALNIQCLEVYAVSLHGHHPNMLGIVVVESSENVRCDFTVVRTGLVVDSPAAVADVDDSAVLVDGSVGDREGVFEVVRVVL